MPDHDRFPPELAGRRDQILAAVIAQGRRRRRRRLGLMVTAVVAPVAVVAAVILSSVSHTAPAQVNVVAPNDVPACQGGGPATGTDAREGARITFGWLPAGWKTVTGGTPFSSAASPTGQLVNGQPSISASYQITSTPLSVLFAPSGQKPAGDYPIVTVDGHPAQVFLPGKGEHLDSSVTWEPIPDVVLTVDDDAQLSESELLRVADGLRFDPGVALASVGDLGAVIPRSQAIATAVSASGITARSSAALGSTAGGITSEAWLVTPSEFDAAHIFPSADTLADQPGVLTTPAESNAPTTPVWVVAVYVDATHWTLVAIDAANGDEIAGTTSGLRGLALPASVTSLVDHAALGACPDPSTHPVDLGSLHLPPQCTFGQLSARYVGERATGGETQLIVALRNTSNRICGLQGTPYEAQIEGTNARNGVGASAGVEIPFGGYWADPLVTLQPDAAALPATVTDPDSLPSGTAWFGLTDQPTQSNTRKCPPTTVTGITFSLPFDATMPQASNLIPTIRVAGHPATVDDCGMGFTSTYFQAA